MNKALRTLPAILIALLLVCTPAALSNSGNYAPWGIDEYQLFGLTKQELSKKFDGKLFFSKDFKRATFSKEGTGLGYQGPVFYLFFDNGKVSSVHGVFEGCKRTIKRPHFDSKREALDYAIKHLAKYKGNQERKNLAKAKKALAALKSAQ